MADVKWSSWTTQSAPTTGNTLVGLSGGVNVQFGLTGTWPIDISGEAASAAAIIGLAANTLYGNASNTGPAPGGVITLGTGLAFSGSQLINTVPSPTPAALTEESDTNVTLTLGGTPASALLAATSITAGWSGLLSPARGGTGVNNGASTLTYGGNTAFSGAYTFAGTLTANTAITFPTSGTLATTAQLPTQGIVTIDANNGSVTGTTISIKASTSTAGSSVFFNGSGTAMTFNVTDGNLNTVIGENAGGSISGINSVGLGYGVFGALTTGNHCVGVGVQAFYALTGGTYNVGVGFAVGLSYTGAESSNILLNSAGVAAESNVLRIGSGTGTGTQQLNAAYISGIYDIAPAGTQQVALIGSGNQVGGSTTLPAGLTIPQPVIKGVVSGGAAAAGVVGEIISSSILAANSITLTTSGVAYNLTSISLTDGDWDVWGNVSFNCTSSSAYDNDGWISITSATRPDLSLYSATQSALGTEGLNGFVVPSIPLFITTPTTVYLSVLGNFSNGSMTACGNIYARRRR